MAVAFQRGPRGTWNGHPDEVVLGWADERGQWGSSQARVKAAQGNISHSDAHRLGGLGERVLHEWLEAQGVPHEWHNRESEAWSTCDFTIYGRRVDCKAVGWRGYEWNVQKFQIKAPGEVANERFFIAVAPWPARDPVVRLLGGIGPRRWRSQAKPLRLDDGQQAKDVGMVAEWLDRPEAWLSKLRSRQP